MPTINSLDDVDLADEPQVVYPSKRNKKPHYLIDQFVSGNHHRFSFHCTYIIRDKREPKP